MDAAPHVTFPHRHVLTDEEPEVAKVPGEEGRLPHVSERDPVSTLVGRVRIVSPPAMVKLRGAAQYPDVSGGLLSEIDLRAVDPPHERALRTGPSPKCSTVAWDVVMLTKLPHDRRLPRAGPNQW